jgi:hypothetical protein
MLFTRYCPDKNCNSHSVLITEDPEFRKLYVKCSKCSLNICIKCRQFHEYKTPCNSNMKIELVK